MKRERSWGRFIISLILGLGLACGLFLLLAGVAVAWYSAHLVAQLPPNMPMDALAFPLLGGMAAAVVGLVLVLVFGIIALVRRILRGRADRRAASAA